MILGCLAGFAAAFVVVFFKSFQQKNVIHETYGAVIPTSIAINVAELVVVGIWVINIIDSAFVTAFVTSVCMGVGGGLGSISSVVIHNHLFKKGQK